jgi:CRP-like cAMP-binding protein
MAHLLEITSAFEFAVLTLTVPGLRLRKYQNPLCFRVSAPFSSSLTAEFRLNDPAPAVRTVEYSDFSVIYRVSFSVAKQEELAAARDQFMTRLWYAVRRSGLTIPFPITMEYSPGENPGAPKVEPSEWLRNYPRFKHAIQNSPAATPRVMEYAAGETVQAVGSSFSGFALILSGQARLRALSADGVLVEIGQIGPGECFGEQLTAGPSADAIEIAAISDTRVMVFDGKTIGDLLNQSPNLAAEIGDAIESRHQAARAARARTKKKLSVNAG